MKQPVSGIGLGLRVDLADALLELRPKQVDWLEIHPENYMRRGGRFPRNLARAKEHWPIITHGLTMGFGNTDPFDPAYLSQLRAFLRDVGTPWHSDHMCFGGAHGQTMHDLLPLPFHETALRLMAERIDQARTELDIDVAFENLSYYVEAPESELSEAEFVRALLVEADAKMLLDVNNVYVNSQNLGFDPRAWIDQIPGDRVLQIHIAGHYVGEDGFRIDTHAEDVSDDVFELLDYTLARIGPRPILLERDGNYPSLEVLLAQLDRIAAIANRHESSPANGNDSVESKATENRKATFEA